MPTSIHLPAELLAAVDARAKALKISRSMLIARSIERELSHENVWSPGFFEALSPLDDATTDLVHELLIDVRSSRRSKLPPKL